MSYGIEKHTHRFAAWAASRAASVRNCRFPVKIGVDLIEQSGMPVPFSNPDQLPCPTQFDDQHREWRNKIVENAASLNPPLPLTHGIAAKLINVYLKTIFVGLAYHDNTNVRAIHPPIDSILLDDLAAKTCGTAQAQWRMIPPWSTLSSGDYEQVIRLIREHLEPTQPMWKIERYWRGYR